MLTAFAVAVNLALLGFFKYTGFFAHALNSFVAFAGVNTLPVLKIVLPVGISFYTFKIIGYLVDIYRGQPPARSLLDFACYVSFFPQLLSGPIQRYGTIDFKSEPVPTFADQLIAREHTLDKFSWGVALFMLGFAKKILLANAVGQVADAVFAARVARHLGRVVRRPGLHVPIVLRLLRLFGDGHRPWADAGLRVPRAISTRRTVPTASATSGGGGTSPCRAGCGTISTSRSAAIGSGPAGRTSI